MRRDPGETEVEEEEDVVEEDMGAVADMEAAVVEAMVRIYSCHAMRPLKECLLPITTSSIDQGCSPRKSA